MTEAGAQKAVLGAFLAIGAMLVYEDIRLGRSAKPPFKQLVALAALAAALAAGASAAPDIAGPLAILIAIGYLTSKIGVTK